MPVRPVPVAGRIVIAMLARAPAVPDDGLLGRDLALEQHLAIREALFDDCVDVLLRIRGVAPVVVCEPADARTEVRKRVPPQIAVVGQAGDSVGGHLSAACESFREMGARGVVFVGSTAPDLPASRIRGAVECLTEDSRRIVLGPTEAGGCYLLGIGTCCNYLVSGIEWGRMGMITQVRRLATSARLQAVELEPWPDVRTLADVGRIVKRRSRAARRTRAWARALARINGP